MNQHIYHICDENPHKYRNKILKTPPYFTISDKGFIRNIKINYCPFCGLFLGGL